MSDEILSIHKQELEYFQNWIRNLGRAEAALPYVLRMRDLTEWKIAAIEQAPAEATEIPLGKPIATFENEFSNIQMALPKIANYEISSLISIGGTVTSGSSDLFDYVTRVGDIPTTPAKVYATTITSQYHCLQERQNRVDEVKHLLASLPGNSLERFERAEQLYQQYRVDKQYKPAAAMEMRTFIDGLQGQLQQFAKRNPKANTPSWEDVASRLAKNEKKGSEYLQLIREGTTHSLLVGKLSTIGKDREGSFSSQLENIWTEVLDHAYAVLTQIDMTKFPHS